MPKRRPQLRRPSVALVDYDVSTIRNSAMSSLILLFAIFEGICGFVLPICNAFSLPTGSLKRYYYEHFLLIQYTLSILALFYLQALIFYYDRKENDRIKRHLISRQNDIDYNNHEDVEKHSQEVQNINSSKLQITNTEPPQFSNSLADITIENGVASSEGPDEQCKQHDRSSIKAKSSLQLMSTTGLDQNEKSTLEPFNNNANENDFTRYSRRIYKRVKTVGVIPLKFIFGDQVKPISRRECYFSRDTQGVNLYLRLGAVGFGFGVMIFDGFKIAEPWEIATKNINNCHGMLWIPTHFLHFIYVFWQTYFLFKHHRVVFNVHKFVLRFLLCHLAIANLCQWLKTIVDEINNERAHGHTSELSPHVQDSSKLRISHIVNDTLVALHSQPVNELHTTSNLTVDENGWNCGSTAKHLAPYLYPCAIEYSLIAAAIFYKMFEKIGHLRKESERLKRLRKANPVLHNYSECHRSHKGLFVGLLMFMATLVTMSLFFIFFVRPSRRNAAIALYHCTELGLLSVGIITCLLCVIRLRILKLSDLSEEGAFDNNLLLIGLVGMIFYDLFLLIPALEELPSGRLVAKLFAAKAILEMLQSLMQVFFILEASRRCAGTVEHVRRKPGRTLIILLLILNLAMWFVNTFEVKRADNNSIHINYYNEMTWKIITHISLPMIVFFRFHSTVCLSDIWANAYTFRTK